MLKKSFLLLGGTGYLGNVISKNKKFAFFKFGRKQFNSENLNINYILDFIQKNSSIEYIVDFTRNTKKSIIPFIFLLKKIPKHIHYVNISTFNLNDEQINESELEYLETKQMSEKYMRENDYIIRLPWIIKNKDSILEKDLEDISLPYYYYCLEDDFYVQFYKILTYKPGLYNISAKKEYI